MSYTPAIVASLISFMFDVKRWMVECIAANLSGHTLPHQFKLLRGPDGWAVIYYKEWSTTKDWPQKSGGIQLLTARPMGVPSLVNPDVSKLELDKIAQDLLKYDLNFDEETTKWWNTFIENNGLEGGEEAPLWILPLLRSQPPKP